MSDFMKKFSLEGKVALITGASYGIGFAIASALSLIHISEPTRRSV